MSEQESAEIGIRDLRASLADVVLETGTRGRITYVTHRGRRIAALVPLDIAEAAEAQRAPSS